MNRSTQHRRKARFGGFFAAALAAAVWFGATAPAAALTTIRDAEIEATLRDFVDPIFRAANLDPSQIDIVIVQDPSINAFVTDSRTMYIHTGLITAAETPNELKGVMAHETGHIAGSHNLRTQQALGRAMRPALLSVGLGILAIAAGAPDAGAALIAGSQQFAYADFVQFSQAQESQADQAAITFMDGSGQSAEGLVEFASRQFRYNEMRSASRIPPWLRTHPLWSDRIQAMRQRVSEAPNRDVRDTPEQLAAFKLMQGKLNGYLDSPGRTALKYPESDISAPARYARAIAAMRASDFAKADKEASALLAQHPDNPYYHEMMGEILLTSGRIADSIPHQRRALALRPNNALLELNLARALLATNKPDALTEAIQHLKAATRSEPENASVWFELARAYDTSGDQGLARLASAEMRYSVGDWSAAASFAQRAKEHLEQGTVSYQRASDIVVISESRVRIGRGQ